MPFPRFLHWTLFNVAKHVFACVRVCVHSLSVVEYKLRVYAYRKQCFSAFAPHVSHTYSPIPCEIAEEERNTKDEAKRAQEKKRIYLRKEKESSISVCA